MRGGNTVLLLQFLLLPATRATGLPALPPPPPFRTPTNPFGHPGRSSACPTVYPTPSAATSSDNPPPPYPIQISLSSSSSSNSSSSSTSDSNTNSSSTPVELGFLIPADLSPSSSSSSSSGSGSSGSCTLVLNLSSPDAHVSGTGANVNVYALDGPEAGELVGTTWFGPGAVATVNSFACRVAPDEMCFRFEVAPPEEAEEGQGQGQDGGGDDGQDGTKDDAGAQTVQFMQGDALGTGLAMKVGC